MQNRFRPRNPLLALTMSLVLPGFGQLYNGELNKAIWLFLGFALLSIPGLALIALYLPATWMMPAAVLGMIVGISIWLYGMVDAWKAAHRATAYVLPEWQVGGMYALVFLLCDGLALPLMTDYVRTHQVASFRIPSNSMEPSVLRGDIIFADRRYNCPGCATAISRGDVAIFTYPNDRTLNYIKRVIALPGDRVRIDGHTVSVNGRPLTVQETAGSTGLLVTEASPDRQWQVQWSPMDKPPAATELTVPPGQVFVLGDNRSTSKDTRDFGTVPMQDIIGKARQIWFSWGAPGGVRWGRLGKVVE